MRGDRVPGGSSRALKRVRHGIAWVLLYPFAIVWIVLRVLMIPVYWLIVILPMPVAHLMGREGEWDRWAEAVLAVVDSPFHFVSWIGGKDWNP